MRQPHNAAMRIIVHEIERFQDVLIARERALIAAHAPCAPPAWRSSVQNPAAPSHPIITQPAGPDIGNGAHNRRKEIVRWWRRRGPDGDENGGGEDGGGTSGGVPGAANVEAASVEVAAVVAAVAVMCVAARPASTIKPTLISTIEPTLDGDVK